MKITPAEVETVLTAADNLNSALKNLLKREAQAENSVENFAKGLRSVVTRNREGELLAFIEKHYPTKEVHFAILVSYAFPGVRDTIVGAVVDEYGDAFNATFERRDNKLYITNEDKFSAITRQVVKKVEEGLDQSVIPRNNFSVYSMLATIFEPDVLVEVLEII